MYTIFSCGFCQNFIHLSSIPVTSEDLAFSKHALSDTNRQKRSRWKPKIQEWSKSPHWFYIKFGKPILWATIVRLGLQNIVRFRSWPGAYCSLVVIFPPVTWALTACDELQRGSSVWQAIQNTWLCFVHPVLLIITHEAQFWSSM